MSISARTHTIYDVIFVITQCKIGEHLPGPRSRYPMAQTFQGGVQGEDPGKIWLAYPEPWCPQLNSFLLKMDEEAAGGVSKTLYEARRERHRYYFSDLVCRLAASGIHEVGELVSARGAIDALTLHSQSYVLIWSHSPRLPTQII